MTENQSIKISEFIDALPDEIADKMFEELIAGMSIFFGTIVFGEQIDNVFEKLKKEKKTLEEIATYVKENKNSQEEIYAELMKNLEDDSTTEIFADECVSSISFNPNYPKEILKKLEELEIDQSDFSANMIITFKDQFIDFFVNDLDVVEWSDDIIDALISNW